MMTELDDEPVTAVGSEFQKCLKTRKLLKASAQNETITVIHMATKICGYTHLKNFTKIC